MAVFCCESHHQKIEDGGLAAKQVTTEKQRTWKPLGQVNQLHPPKRPAPIHYAVQLPHAPTLANLSSTAGHKAKKLDECTFVVLQPTRTKLSTTQKCTSQDFPYAIGKSWVFSERTPSVQIASNGEQPVPPNGVSLECHHTLSGPLPFAGPVISISAATGQGPLRRALLLKEVRRKEPSMSFAGQNHFPDMARQIDYSWWNEWNPWNHGKHAQQPTQRDIATTRCKCF